MPLSLRDHRGAGSGSSATVLVRSLRDRSVLRFARPQTHSARQLQWVAASARIRQRPRHQRCPASLALLTPEQGRRRYVGRPAIMLEQIQPAAPRQGPTAACPFCARRLRSAAQPRPASPAHTTQCWARTPQTSRACELGSGATGSSSRQQRWTCAAPAVPCSAGAATPRCGAAPCCPQV